MSARHELLLALARADGQPWASIAEATEHTAEIMYGEQADAVIAHLFETATREAVRTAAARAAYESQWGISWNKRAERGESSAHRTADAVLFAFLRAIGGDQ